MYLKTHKNTKKESSDHQIHAERPVMKLEKRDEELPAKAKIIFSRNVGAKT